MLKILYEDNHIIAVLKPAGILIQKEKNEASLDMMVKSYLKDKYNKPGNVFLGIVHRLDKPVSGIILFAKTSKGASRLSAQFRERSIEKEYRAVLIGKIKAKKGVLKSKIVKEKKDYFRAIAVSSEVSVLNSNIRQNIFHKEKEAELEYRVMQEGDKNSFVEIKLKTGRFHQIRAQFASIGHPVIGDIKYGSPILLPGKKIALHAFRLAFASATEEKRIELIAPEPEYFKELL